MAYALVAEESPIPKSERADLAFLVMRRFLVMRVVVETGVVGASSTWPEDVVCIVCSRRNPLP